MMGSVRNVDKSSLLPEALGLANPTVLPINKDGSTWKRVLTIATKG
jgi:hypothetical protein